jgi:hypothetical protein
MSGAVPVVAPDAVITGLRARVRLISGPFEGQLRLHQGQLAASTRILLGWLGRSVTVTVPNEAFGDLDSANLPWTCPSYLSGQVHFKKYR